MKKAWVIQLIAVCVVAAMFFFPMVVISAEAKELREENTKLQHEIFELNNYIMKEIDQE